MASEVMARELDDNPMMILNMPRRKLVAMNKQPPFSMAWLRVFLDVFGWFFDDILSLFYHNLV